MKNLAPAIFPPKGIGDAKPSNKAVLDWVQRDRNADTTREHFLVRRLGAREASF